MNEQRLRESLHRAMDTRLSGLTTDPFFAQRAMRAPHRQGRRMPLALAMALLLAMLAVTAVAARGSAVLAYLFGGNSETAQHYEHAVEEIGAHFACSGMEMTLCDALMKDGELSFGLLLRVDAPTYVVIDAVRVNGVRCDISTSNIEEMWAGNDPTGEKGRLGEEIVRGFSLSLPEGTMQGAWVEVTLSLLRPRKRICMVNTGAPDEMVWQEIDAAIARGETPVELDEPHAVLVPRAYFGAQQTAYARPLGDSVACEAWANMEAVMQTTSRRRLSVPAL